MGDISALNIITTILSNFSVLYFGMIFFNKDLSNIKKINSIIIQIILFFSVLILPRIALTTFTETTRNFIKTSTSFILMVYIFKSGLMVSTGKAFIANIINFIFTIGYQLFLLLGLSLLQININEYINYIQVFYATTTLILLFLLKDKILLLKRIAFKKFKLDERLDNNIIINLIFILFMAIYLLAFTAGLLKAEQITNKGLILLILLLVIITYLIVSTYMKNRENKRQIAELNARHKLSKIHNDYVDSINNFAHNYNNTMATIQAFVDNKELPRDALRKELSQILDWNEDNSIYEKVKYLNIPNLTIASLISTKYEKARQYGVDFIVNYQGNSKINLNTKDLIDVFSVVLDNAIEAAALLDKNKYVDIYLNFKKDCFECTLKNNYKTNSNSDILKQGISRGIGLKYIEKLQRGNENLEVIAESNKQKQEFKVFIKIK